MLQVRRREANSARDERSGKTGTLPNTGDGGLYHLFAGKEPGGTAGYTGEFRRDGRLRATRREKACQWLNILLHLPFAIRYTC